MKKQKPKKRKITTSQQKRKKLTAFSTPYVKKRLFPDGPTRVFSNDPLYGQFDITKWWGGL